MNQSNARRLVANGEYPSWSPDGKQIAFAYIAPGDASIKSSGIAVINADGSNEHRIVSAREHPTDTTACIGGDPGGASITTPAWSPDGKLIAYSDNGRLCLSKSDGTQRHCFATGFASTPSWSPNGKRIAFLQGDPNNTDVFGFLRIAVIDRDGRNLRVLQRCCEGGAIDSLYGPAWSESNLIAYGDGPANCLIQPHTRRLFLLNTNDPVTSLAWSPDSRQVAYSTQAANSFRLITVKPKQVTAPLAKVSPIGSSYLC